MSRFNAVQQSTARLLVAVMLLLGLQTSVAQAGMVSTHTQLKELTLQQDRTVLLKTLSQQEAVDAMLTLGVSPEEVQQRVNNMTTEELAALQHQMDDLQAGGSSLVGAVVLVFVVLIVLDLLGTTNIFPAIKPIDTSRPAPSS